MFDSKIIIYVESTKGAKIFGGLDFPLISKLAPQKWTDFSGCTLKGPQKRPYILARRQKKSKTPVYFFSSASGLEDKPVSSRLTLKFAVPQPFG